MQKPILFSLFLSFILLAHAYGKEDIILYDNEIIGKGLSKATISEGMSVSVGPESVVVVFVDFPDGRLDGQPPANKDELQYLEHYGNLNAVGSMGWIKDGSYWQYIVRKYTYDHYWNWIFSDSPTYTGTTANPDYASHGSDVEPYGSLKDYYREVSNNKFTITPAKTWDNGTPDMYNTGILNAYDIISGKKYIRWLMMPENKTYYYNGRYGPERHEVISAINSSSEINFDINSFLDNGGKLIAISAGSALVGHEECFLNDFMSIREKRYNNDDTRSTMDGLWFLVHEYGHSLGFDHLAASSYDPMNPFFHLTNWGKLLFCPQHINPIYKLQKGWLTHDDVIKVPSGSTLYTEIPAISITSSSKKVVAVTVYGDAGRTGSWDSEEDWTHSEYFLLEYRTRDGFNRFAGGISTPGFKGGVLIWHRSKYGVYHFDGGWNKIGLKIAGYADENHNTEFLTESPDPSHFFHPGHPSITPSGSPNTNSYFDLYTSISMTNFDNNNNYGLMFVTFKYDKMLPTYTEFYDNGYKASNISGTVFLATSNSNLTVSDGTTVDVNPGSSIAIDSIIADGSSTNSITFKGVGYGNERIPWKGVIIRIYDTGQSIIRNCLIKDANLAIEVGLDGDEIEPIIQDVQFENCSDDIKLNNLSTVYKNLTGYDDNDFSQLTVGGKWKIDDNVTFTIPSGSNLKIDYGSYIQLGTGTEINIYGSINAIGSVSRPKWEITFDFGTISTNPANGLKFQSGSDGELKYCTIKNGYYGVSVTGISNPPKITYCNFTNNWNGIYYNSAGNLNDAIAYNTISNNKYGIFIGNGSAAYIKSCTIKDNTDAGCHIYSNSTARLTGNHIYNNGKGVYSSQSYTRLYGNIIENNNFTGILSTSYDVMRLGYVSSWAGKNTVRNNYDGSGTDYEICAANGSDVDLFLSSVYNDHGCEINNFTYGPSSSVLAFNVWFEADGLTNCGRTVSNEFPILSEPYWNGNLYTNDYGVPKTAAANEMIAFSQPDALPDKYRGYEGLLSLKEKIKDKKTNDDEKSAILHDIYSMLRADYRDDTFGEKNKFISFLENDVKKQKISQLTTDALRYEIIWNSLEGNYSEAISLSKTLIPNLSDEDKMRSMLNLTNLYLQAGDLEQAKKTLEEVIAQYGTDDPEIILLTEEINASNVGSKIIAKNSKDEVVPENFDILQNYPNPFNPVTTIPLLIPEKGHVKITVYNILGQQVTILAEKDYSAGQYQLQFNGNSLASGVYIIKAKFNSSESNKNYSVLKRMLLLK
ncbi:MAG: right-handed parallel beta-helix repeat-containing protein [Calditrichaceae bacterium]|nr:right-handed parallel beta-helix repeat-containing protein [Calditrichaceae bacterium]MBN2708367.1 right-handed parallel beta-helix repeat-containing protein [Calditrichaceae bacterium]RQV93110.1 MAG: T9SS C-terminal target domain-containing protein [Calditrichota bacterium]